VNASPSVELIGNIVGALLAAGTAVWVNLDARKRGLQPRAALGWSAGVFLLLIVFLPLYLWTRTKSSSSSAASPRPIAPIAGVPCRYCGYANAGDPDYCGKCGRQMRSSNEIHR